MSLEKLIKNFTNVREILKKTRPQLDQVKDGPALYDRVTYEAITSQDQDGTVNVRGYRIAPFSKVLFRSGEFVYVGWKGAEPVGILKFAWQKAHFAPVSVTIRRGIVEELFIASDASGTDVFFRNYDQVTALNVKKFIGGGIPQDVFWGMNEDVFGIRVGADEFHVLRLKRDDLTTIISEGTTVVIQELLYSIILSDFTVDIATITAVFDRAGGEPIFPIDVSFTGSSNIDVGTMQFNGVDHSTNLNEAHVERTATMKLKGVSQFEFEESHEDIVVNKPTATLQGVVIDENNDLIYSVAINMVEFGMKQGNDQAGLTGQFKKRNHGTQKNFGFFDIFAEFPFVDDINPIMDFNGHGNPGGVLPTVATEVHSVLINARTQTIVFSTLATNPIVEVHEDISGQTPYFASHYNFFFIFAVEHAYVPDGHLEYQTQFGPIIGDFNLGIIGHYGVKRSDRSLFNQTLSFTPDIADRTAEAISVDITQHRYLTENTDGWHAFNHREDLFFPGNKTVHMAFRIPVIDIVHRYEVQVHSKPFWAVGSNVYHFVTVLRRPYNDPSTGFTNDPIQIGVFILSNTEILVTALNYTTVSEIVTPQFMTGNSERVFWRIAANWFMTDLTTGVSFQVGDDADAEDVQGFVLLHRDFLYSTRESDEIEPFFVQMKDGDGNFILNQTGDPEFPRKEGTPLDELGSLKDIPGTLQPTEPSYQAIMDSALIDVEEET